MLSTPGELLFWEKYRFCSSHQKPDSPKIMKSVIYKSFYQNFNTVLNNYELDFIHQGPNLKLDILGWWFNI